MNDLMITTLIKKIFYDDIQICPLNHVYISHFGNSFF